MSEDLQLGATYSQQREPGSVRTALPSRPMSFKGRDDAGASSQDQTKSSVESENQRHRQTLGGCSPNPKKHPATGSLTKTEPSGQSIPQLGVQPSPSPGGGQSHGQVCR